MTEEYTGRGNGPNYYVDSDGDVWICRGYHDKSDGCHYERASVEEQAAYKREHHD